MVSLETEQMLRSLPSLRTVAVLLLVVVGVSLSFAFHASMGGASVTYTATAVEPGENPDLVTRAAMNVTNLNERLAGTSPQHQQPIEKAAATGAYSGRLDPGLDIVIDDIESPHVWYNDRYYTGAVSTESETTNATIRMQPTDPETVFETIVRPADDAPPEVTTAIAEGTATGLTVESGVYRHNGKYYAVAPENEGAVFVQLAKIFGGYVLTPVGRGYAAVGIALLAYRFRDPLHDCPLTPQRALAIPALAIPVALTGTLLFETGSLTRFITGPMSAFVVATGTVAGVFAARRQWLRLVGATIATALVTIGAFVAALGVVGALLGILAVILGVTTGIVPFGYGYWFAQPCPTE